MSRNHREVAADNDQWDGYQCPEFDGNYQLCLAKLLLSAEIVME